MTEEMTKVMRDGMSCRGNVGEAGYEGNPYIHDVWALGIEMGEVPTMEGGCRVFSYPDLDNDSITNMHMLCKGLAVMNAKE